MKQPEEGSRGRGEEEGAGDPGSEAHRFCGDYGCDRPRGGSAFLRQLLYSFPRRRWRWLPRSENRQWRREASGLHFKIPVIQRVTKVSKPSRVCRLAITTDPARADGASIDNPVSIENESLVIHKKGFNLTNVDFYVEYMVTDQVQAVRHRSVYESIIKNLAQSYIRDTVGVYNVGSDHYRK